MKPILKYGSSAGFGALVLFFFMQTCNKSVPAVPVKQKDLDQVVRNVTDRETNIQPAINKDLNKAAAAERRADSLQARVDVLTRQRNQAQANVHLQEQVINSLPAVPDTACREAAREYMIRADLSEAIADSIIGLQGRQLEAKDTAIAAQRRVITAKDSLYRGLRIDFDTMAVRQKRLIHYSEAIKKQAKKQKAGALIWKGIAAALGGLLLYQNLK